MKTGVVIVNTARGAVMDEDALVRALDSKKVWSCGLDVYEEEPNIHPGLVANPHVMLVPHMGTWTVEVSPQFPLFTEKQGRHSAIQAKADSEQTQTSMEMWNIGNVRAALEKGKLNSPVPEQADMQ